MSASEGQDAAKKEKGLSGSDGRSHAGSHFGFGNQENVVLGKRTV